MSMPTRKEFTDFCKTFYSQDYYNVAMTYYKNSDKFLSIKEVALLAGVRVSIARRAKQQIAHKGVCFVYVGTCNDRKSKMVSLRDWKGYSISAKEAEIRKALDVKSTLKMNSEPRKIVYNKSIVNSTLNSVFN